VNNFIGKEASIRLTGHASRLPVPHFSLDLVAEIRNF
jgi:hypothetical protein